MILTEREKILGILLILAALLLTGGAAAGLIYVNHVENEKALTLTAKDAEIQQLDTQLGIAKSNLTSQKELSSKYKKDLDRWPEKLKKMIRDHDLKLQSKDETIAQLESVVTGEDSQTEVNEKIVRDPGTSVPVKVIEYIWRDKHRRFQLHDPDIKTPNNETFRSNQKFRVKGSVLYTKKGKLQVRKVEVEEVVETSKDNDGNPVYEPVSDSSTNIVDATFDYVDLSRRKRHLMDIFTARVLASFDTAIMPGIGVEFVNLGEFVPWANIGINSKLAVNATDILGGSLQQSRIGLGIHYHLIPPLLDTNLALGASISVPFNDLRSPVFTIDAIFFLTNPVKFIN